MKIRWMIRRDLPAVLAIDERSLGSDPNRPEGYWPNEAALVRDLRVRECIGLVVEDAEEAIVAFVVYHINTPELSITRLAVHPSHRGCGVGRMLIERLQNKLSSGGKFQELVVLIEDFNLGAQLFLKACGLRASGLIITGRSRNDFYHMHYRADWNA